MTGSPARHRGRGSCRRGAGPTTILCPAESLLSVLDAAVEPDVVVAGDPRPPAVLQSWVKRAQSG